MKKRFAIIQDSHRGQTEKIALHIARALHGLGFEAHVYKLRCLPTGFGLEDFDAVILGCSLHMEKYSRPMTKYVAKNRSVLEARESYFYSVSLAVAGGEHGREEVKQCINRFLARTGWTPTGTASFAGALLYRDYNPILRWFMKRIVSKAGGDTDTSQNYEYTDWNAVEDFARHVCL